MIIIHMTYVVLLSPQHQPPVWLVSCYPFDKEHDPGDYAMAMPWLRLLILWSLAEPVIFFFRQDFPKVLFLAHDRMIHIQPLCFCKVFPCSRLLWGRWLHLITSFRLVETMCFSVSCDVPPKLPRLKLQSVVCQVLYGVNSGHEFIHLGPPKGWADRLLICYKKLGVQVLRNCSLSSASRDLAPSFSGKKSHESTSIQYMILRCGMVWLKMIGPLKSQTTQTILFMEEIHQLISRIYHLRGFIGFIHPRCWILVLQIGTRRFESWRHPSLLETSKLPTEGASREWWRWRMNLWMNNDRNSTTWRAKFDLWIWQLRIVPCMMIRMVLFWFEDQGVEDCLCKKRLSQTMFACTHADKCQYSFMDFLRHLWISF